MQNEKSKNYNNRKPGTTLTFLQQLAGELFNQSVRRVVPPMYRLGEDSDNEEAIVNGRRVLTWQLKGNENKLAKVAGWDRLNHIVEEERHGYLFLPEGTRNACSVLAGLEAFEGEKSDVISAGLDYLIGAKEIYGNNDTQFSWGSLAVTPEHDIFVAPPHAPNVESSATEVEEWKKSLVGELTLLLVGDEKNEHLIAAFNAGLEQD